MTQPDEREQWKSEREYFDAQARLAQNYEADVVAARYARFRSRGLYNKEYRIQLLGTIEGQRILDVGCGLGENSLILASLGAEITGIDISEESVSLATARAAKAGLSSRCTFIAEPFERHTPRGGGYDVIWCDAFLHHVIPVLDEVMGQLYALMRPGGLFIANEPVRFNAAFAEARKFIPPFPEGTPDERPLTRDEVERCMRRFTDRTMRTWGPIARLGQRAVSGNVPYEQLSDGVRSMADLFESVDRSMMSTFLGEPLAMLAVFAGRRPMSGA